MRRAIHTLKGDSAACGFQKLSEIAHELEDVLSLQIGQAQGAKLAEVVLSAVDTFESMLSAYQTSAGTASAGRLRSLIHDLLSDSPDAQTFLNECARSPFKPRFRLERVRTADDLRSAA